MPDGVFRHFPRPARAKGRPRRNFWPLFDPEADYHWLQTEVSRLARVHRIVLDPAGASWPIWVIACRVHDPCAPDGWRPAWLEIADDPFDPDADSAPSFASDEWKQIEKDGRVLAEAQYVLAVINHAARTRPDAMIVRDLLVALRSAELGAARDAFEFIELD